MYCPKCGRPAGEHQKFCTGCGTNLLAVSQALASRPVMADEQKGIKDRVCQFRDGMRKMFVGIGLTFFFYFFLNSRALGVIGLLVFFLGLGKMLAAMVFASPRLNIEMKVPSEQPVWDQTGQTRREPPMPAALEPPYVTEQTTVPLDRSPYLPPQRRT